MESLDLLNLRAGECSFLETVLVDVRRYVETLAVENKKQAVLVFPPLSARNRFLIHTLVQNFFTELSTLSIGSSYGRRTVVYHSSIKPMIRETELDEPIRMREDNNTDMHRAYRTPSERKAQEKLFHSLLPKKKVDASLRSTQRKQCKRPDIPIYVPKARRSLTNNVVSNSSSTSNSLHITPSVIPVTNSRTEGDFSDQSCSERLKDSLPTQNSNNHTRTLSLLDSFNFVDLSSDVIMNEVNNDLIASSNVISYQISESLPSSSSHITSSNTTVTNSRTQDDSSDKFCSNDVKDSSPTQNSNDQQHTHILSSLDSFNSVDLSSNMIINKVNNDQIATSNYNSSEISKCLPSISSHITSSNTPVTNSRTQDDSSDKLCSKDVKDSLSTQNSYNQQHNLDLSSLDSFNSVVLSSAAIMDKVNNYHIALFNNNSSEISECLPSSSLPNDVNNVVQVESSIINQDESETNISVTSLNNCDNVLIGLPQSLYDKTVSVCSQNSMPVNLTDFQTPNINSKNTDDNLPELKKIKKSVDQKIVDSIVEVDNENNINEINKQNYEMQKENEITNTSDVELLTEYNSNSPNYCLNDSSTSGPLTDVEEISSTSINEKSFYQNDSKLDDIKVDVNSKKGKKKKKKKILDLNECSWEDLYDKQDDYIHPLLMKELVSTMGKVQVKCTQEDYRSHQTVEERSGNGECVIEVYGFSSELRTVDLMNQFAAFRKNHFEIVWVDDTHALAVFESPNLADRALNTPFALVRTRPLKNAIKESKLKAETVAPLPTTRPKTCTAMARRLVSSALGLKLNVSADLLNAERTMLATAKEKKIRDAQQKHNVWNNES